jgi:hypothetical protein
MFKKTFLFITTILVATSASNGYVAQDFFKGAVPITRFLDWFKYADYYVHTKGLIILDLIPAVFLIVQVVLFFKDKQNIKGFFAALALLSNCIGVFIIIQYAFPIASQMTEWTPNTIPSNWISLKDDWIKYIGIYSLLGILGLLFFLITYFVPTKKSTEPRQLHPILNVIKNTLLFIVTFTSLMSAARLYDFIFFPISYKISGATFIEMHRPVDLAMRNIGPILFTIVLSIYVLLTILYFIEKSKNKAVLIIISILFLLCDTFIALQGNRPLNDLFLTWTPTTLPSDWSSLRDEWLSYHFYRDIFITLQLLCVLLLYFVPKNNSKIKAV